MQRLRLLGSLAVPVIVIGLMMAMDGPAVAEALSRISVADVVVGLLIVQVQILLGAARWRYTAGRLGQVITRPRAISEYYLGSALNQVLPGGVGGDVLRAYRSRQAGEAGLWMSARVVAMERLSGQLAFFAVFGIGLFVWPLAARDGAPRHVLLASAAIAVMLVLLVFIMLRASAGVRRDVGLAFVQDGAWRAQAGYSLAAVASYIGLFCFAAWAIGTPLPWSAALTIIPLCLLSMLIPTGFGGWGTREAAAAALWPLAGLASADGIATSVVYGGLVLTGSLPGIVVLLSTRRASVPAVHDASRA